MIPRALRDLVRSRAEGRCEYCGLKQALVPLAVFHIEHVVPRKHGGSDEPDNLALACFHCNLNKGPNLVGVDPETGAVAALFDPRRQSWDAHFACDGARVIGLTPTGRATARVMNMNALARVELRSELRRSFGPNSIAPKVTRA